jgi:hypothetical protein
MAYGGIPLGARLATIGENIFKEPLLPGRENPSQHREYALEPVPCPTYCRTSRQAVRRRHVHGAAKLMPGCPTGAKLPPTDPTNNMVYNGMVDYLIGVKIGQHHSTALI